MRVKDVAELLGVSRNKVYRLIKQNKIRARKVKGVWIISKDEIKRLAEEKKEKGLQMFDEGNEILDSLKELEEKESKNLKSARIDMSLPAPVEKNKRLENCLTMDFIPQPKRFYVYPNTLHAFPETTKVVDVFYNPEEAVCYEVEGENPLPDQGDKHSLTLEVGFFFKVEDLIKDNILEPFSEIWEIDLEVHKTSSGTILPRYSEVKKTQQGTGWSGDVFLVKSVYHEIPRFMFFYEGGLFLLEFKDFVKAFPAIYVLRYLNQGRVEDELYFDVLDKIEVHFLNSTLLYIF